MNAPHPSHPSTDASLPCQAHAHIVGVSVILEFVLEPDRCVADRRGAAAVDAGDPPRVPLR